MKILWVSNGAFTGTGYGTATKSVTAQLKNNGHDPHVLAYWGLHGSAKLSIDGIPHYSPRTDVWANDYIEDLGNYLKVDFTLIHRDIWVNPEELEEKVPLAAWFPIDHFPISVPIIDHAKRTEWKAIMSKFGLQELNNVGIDAYYIPHSFDSSFYKPAKEIKENREFLGFPSDAFIITIVAANKGVPSRKGFPEMFEAIAEFQKRHSDVWAYVHSMHTREHDGYDLKRLSDFKGCDPNRLLFIDPFMLTYGVDQSTLASFYQMSDVLLNTSYGEGFGIPILEAQACGIPVITTNCTSMPEITFNGYTVNGTKFLYNFYSNWIVPSVGEIVDALEELYKAKGTQAQEKKNQDTAQMLYENWRDEVVYDRYWIPFLNHIESQLNEAKDMIRNKSYP